MKKKLGLFCAISLLCLTAISQADQPARVEGRILNEKNESLPGVSVVIKASGKGTITDDQGYFRLLVPGFPVTLQVSHTGYEMQELEIKGNEATSITLHPGSMILNPVVVGGTRTQIRSLNSPVSHEYAGKFELANTPAESFWSSLLMKKGLDVTTSSLTYKTFSTRGFNGSGSSRVNQFMDGMDNQAPGLNFSVGNFIGLTELDVDNVEILPGASSALYGAGGINGTILVNSKDPFQYPGLSIMVKQGVTDIGKQQRGQAGSFNDFAFRWAKKINSRLAFKIGGQYLRANDWLADDSTNYLRLGSSGRVVPGTRNSDPGYDGVNVYGDETRADLRGFMNSDPMFQTIFAKFLAAPQYVSRTGYAEKDVIDPKTWNLKLSGALHYKITDKLEARLMGYWATGNTVYTGNNRYSLKGIKVGQYKAELRHRNWFLRAYTTQENAGEAYSATVTSQIFNEAWKRSYDPSDPLASWYPQYFGAFATGAGQIFQSVLNGGGSLDDAQNAVYAAAAQLHAAGRAYADQGRPDPGSPQFKQIFNQVRKIPIPNGGLFLDKSQLWMAEGQYNFSDKIKFVELIVGASAKKYILNSKGTLFIDTAGSLKINEWGAYAQATKRLFNNKLTLSASGRYDRNENFAGKFTPRFTALVAIAKDHNLRFSYQTAYHFPTTQQQWIRLNVGDAILLGGLPWITDYIQSKSSPTFVLDPTTGNLAPYEYKELKPESMRSFEAGYKCLIGGKLLIDAYAYFGRYTDFLGRIILVQPTADLPYSVVTNSNTKVNTHGFGLGLDYTMNKNYFLFVNAYSDKLTNVPDGFGAAFNTPEFRVNAGFGNSGMGKSGRLGYMVNLRWQDRFFWEGAGFADGNVPSYTTLDAQVHYKLPKIKTVVKLGGTNITNKFYKTGFGNPSIGGLYYLSLSYNIF